MTPRLFAFIPFIFDHEGSVFENDPDDAGGATKFGIDQRSHPDVNIRGLTEDVAQAIYFHDYWAPLHCEELPKGVGEVVMDIGVNNGKDRAARWLQEAVGAKIDGKIGPLTVAAAVAHVPTIADELLARRESFYISIAKGSQAKYLKGWLNRNNDLRSWVEKL